ncbi:hypothetical protein [Roseiconus lacunae]|nr:hypothetical protein [Roseiconus lacunae]MCD0462232.1 hypothetical protein [Roseiconus lacunae]
MTFSKESDREATRQNIRQVFLPTKKWRLQPSREAAKKRAGGKAEQKLAT